MPEANLSAGPSVSTRPPARFFDHSPVQLDDLRFQFFGRFQQPRPALGRRQDDRIRTAEDKLRGGFDG
jgi:hypothetical protein